MSLFTPIEDDGSTEGKIVAVETFKAVADAVGYLIDSMPVGTVVPILSGWNAVPDPNPNVWQQCNGSPVTNPNSPLHGQLTPDLLFQKLYPRGAPSVGQSGMTGGKMSINNLGHDHNDDVAWTVDPQFNQGGGGLIAAYFDAVAHHHRTYSDVNGTYSIEPEHLTVRFYIKIL